LGKDEEPKNKGIVSRGDKRGLFCKRQPTKRKNKEVYKFG
jgi:hypothetical protein